MSKMKRGSTGLAIIATTCLLAVGLWAQAPYVDITNHWAKDEISFLVGQSIVKGTSDTRITPDGTLKPSEWQTMLTRLGLPINQNATNEGTNAFAISRENAVQMLYRAYTGSLSPEALMKLSAVSTPIDNYKDTQTIDKSALSAFEWAVASKLINGNPQGELKPDQALTRAEGMVMMYRFMKSDSLVSSLSGNLSDALNQNALKAVKAALRNNTEGQLVLDVDWGQKSTGGYMIKIDHVELVDQALHVYVTTTSPAPDAMVTQALTYPKDSLIVKLSGVTDKTPIVIKATK